MATRNRTLIFRKYRDALKSVRAPSTSSSSGAGGVIELGLLKQNSNYAPLSTTEDPGTSSYVFLHLILIISDFYLCFIASS
jgi:syntaxin 16